jgi:hypothetical protein
MNLEKLWPVDPKTQQRSASLLILILSVVAMLVAIGFELAGKAKGVSLVTEFFYGSAALYFGQRIGWGKGNVSGVLPQYAPVVSEKLSAESPQGDGK